MPFQRTVKNMQRKTMNIAAEKHPQTNTVKILCESFFFFQNKTCKPCKTCNIFYS